MRLQPKGKNILSGNLFLGILQFTLPIFLSTLVQTMFTAVDTAVVGNFADAVSVASIGACGPIINLMVNCFIAIATGAGIIIAKNIGAGDPVAVKKSVDTALVLSVFLGLFILAATELLAVPLLISMECPAECLELSSTYLRIYMLGTPAIIIYNFAAAIIRAEGDSTRPLYYIIISGVIHVVTNLLLCLILPNKVAAVAISTVFSQVISAFLSMYRLMTKKDGLCTFSVKKIAFDWRSLGEIFRYGLPMVINNSLFSFTNVQIQTAVNSFGPTIMAGITAGNNLDGFVNALQNSFNTTCATFASQNIGAKNKKRSNRAILICCSCAITSGLVLGLSATYIFSEPLLSIFLPGNAEAIHYGQLKMQYTTAFFGVTAAYGCINAAVQSLGYPSFPTINNLASVFGIRLIWMNFIYVLNPGFEMLFMCYPISWCTSAVISIICLCYAYNKHWKKVTPAVAEA